MSIEKQVELARRIEEEGEGLTPLQLATISALLDGAAGRPPPDHVIPTHQELAKYLTGAVAPDRGELSAICLDAIEAVLNINRFRGVGAATPTQKEGQL